MGATMAVATDYWPCANVRRSVARHFETARSVWSGQCLKKHRPRHRGRVWAEQYHSWEAEETGDLSRSPRPALALRRQLSC
jgi:hypothetical protein